MVDYQTDFTAISGRCYAEDSSNITGNGSGQLQLISNYSNLWLRHQLIPRITKPKSKGDGHGHQGDSDYIYQHSTIGATPKSDNTCLRHH